MSGDNSYEGAAPDDGGTDYELGKELLERCEPLTEGSPPWHYLVEARGLPEPAVRYCSTDLRALAPPIPGFDRLAYGVVSLLRDPRSGEVTGLALDACGSAGERSVDKAGRTARKSHCLVPNGVRDGLFMVKAVGQNPMITYAVEGRLAKVVAVAAIFENPAIVGWGARGCLGRAVPPESTVYVVEDARPADETEAAVHDQQLERGVDDLILTGKLVWRAGGPPCGCCKDVDAALGKHPVEQLRAWIGGAAVTELSLHGHARKCARIKDPLRRGQAVADAIEQQQLRKRGLTKAFRDQVAKFGGASGDVGEDEDDAVTPPVEDVLPWPYPVDGAEVLDAVVAAIQRHVNLSLEAAHAVALWTAHSHALDLAWFNPRLAICSPVKRCGKTTLVEVLTGLVARPKPTSGVTPSVVFRMIDKWHPTYLIDEADGYLPENEQLRSVLNSGHTRTAASVDRTENNADGTREPKSFSTWTPLVVAGIGRLPSTLDDRSIKIRLQRKPRSLKLVRFRADRISGITELGRKLARFVLDNQISISAADIEPPEELHDRAADNWRPLLAIAEVAGGAWSERARKAALTLEDAEQAVEDLCVELLADIRRVFATQTDPAKRAVLFSTELLGALLAMTDRPWIECGRNERPLTVRGMAVLLKPFGIRTNQNVRRGRQQAKGFHVSAFADAFSNYLPSEESHRSQGPSPGNPPVSDDREESHDRSHEESRPNGSGTGTAGTAGGTDAGTDRGTDDFGLKAAEMAAGTDGTDGTDSRPPFGEQQKGNGAAGPDLRCAYCTMAFLPGDEPVEIDGKVYHSDDACAGTIRRRRAAPPPPPPPQPSPPPAGKQRRIKGADTDPGVEGL